MPFACLKHATFATLLALSVFALADDLASGFATAPAAARPLVLWFPQNGNLTKDGFTADLEAMARVGVGGALSMEVDQGAPKGLADFAVPLRMEMAGHILTESKRLSACRLT